MRDFVPDDFLPEPDALRDVPADGPSHDERIPDELVDAFFDGELDEDASREFMRDLRDDAKTARDVVSTNTALEALRRPLSTPDFSSSILDRVHGRSPWLIGRQFALLTHWRMAAAAVFLVLMTGAFLAQRAAPGSTTFTERVAPVSAMSESLPDATAGFARTMNVSFDMAREIVSTPSCKDTEPGATVCFTTVSARLLGPVRAPSESAPKAIVVGDRCEDTCGVVRRRCGERAPTVGVVNVVHTLRADGSDSGTVIIK